MDNQNNYITCVKCGFKIDETIYPEANYCPRCGLTTQNYCPKCSKDKNIDSIDELSRDDGYCYVCGSKTVYHEYLVTDTTDSPF